MILKILGEVLCAGLSEVCQQNYVVLKLVTFKFLGGSDYVLHLSIGMAVLAHLYFLIVLWQRSVAVAR